MGSVMMYARTVFDGSAVRNRILYGLIGFPVGLAWFVIFSIALSLSGGLLVVLVGFVLLSFTLRIACHAAGVERRLLSSLLNVDIARPPRHPNPDNGLVEVILEPLRNGAYWRELFFILARFPLGLLGFVTSIVVVAGPLWALSTVIWGWNVFGGWTVLIVVLGLLSLLVGPVLLAGVTGLNVALAHILLGPSQTDLTARARGFEQSRDRSVEVAEAERRRIERDLHDGAQARLATVALDLGRAKRRLEQGGSVEELGRIIDSAHGDAKAAIVELRDLARGIHPAVLTDRGLDAALSEIAARSPTPVHLDVQMTTRPPAPIESAAYFAVCELLNNSARHASATNVWVTVRGTRDELVIDVSDDGVGGVDARLGTGISGLHDRMLSLDGTMSINSPLGGGTSAIIELPVA